VSGNDIRQFRRDATLNEQVSTVLQMDLKLAKLEADVTATMLTQSIGPLYILNFLAWHRQSIFAGTMRLGDDLTMEQAIRLVDEYIGEAK
jgi:hypothetical protein